MNFTDEQMEKIRPLLLLMAYAEKTFEKDFYGKNVIPITKNKTHSGIATSREHS